jgi:GT2 family glycosyltransferase
MNLSILTLSWNGLDKLKTLYGGVSDNCSYLPKNIQYTWHIRDNGSSDDTIKVVNGWGRNWIKTYDIGHNRHSFSAGMNFLFDKVAPADDDLILLLNNDVEFGDMESLSKMIQLMSKPNAAVVGARLLYAGTNKIQFGGTIFSSKYGNLAWHYRAGEESDKAAEKNRYFQAVTAAVCLVKASSFKRVGGFDEEFMWSFEDVDLCLKIGQTEKIAYCGETKIYHEESASLKKNPVNKMFMQHNVNHFKSKWWENGKPKYKIDHDLYLKDSGYNEIKV